MTAQLVEFRERWLDCRTSPQSEILLAPVVEKDFAVTTGKDWTEDAITVAVIGTDDDNETAVSALD